MKKNQLLKSMMFISWVVFIGLLIKTGTILFLYFLSISAPEISKNLFDGINLYEYYNHSFIQYSFIVSYKVALFVTEAYIAFLVIQLLSKLNLKNPFNNTVQKLTQQISYSIFSLWILAILHNTHVRYIAKKHHFSMDLFSSDFIFLAGVVFIFAQILKRGIELQQENDLTI